MPEVKFYNHTYWESNDSLRTANTLRVALLVSKDQYGVSVGRTQLTISNYKNRSRNSANLTFKDLFQYMTHAKVLMAKHDGVITMPLTQNRKFLTIPSDSMEYGNKSVILIISERGEGFLDSEKFYMSLTDYTALVKLLFFMFENYPMIVSTIQNTAMLDAVHTELTELKTKMANFYQLQLGTANGNNVTVNNTSIPLVEGDEIQDDLSNFLDKNLEKMELPIAAETIAQMNNTVKQKRETQMAEEVRDVFTKNVIDNDAQNLENLLMGFSTSELPFYQLLYKLNIAVLNPKSPDSVPNMLSTFFPGCSEKEFSTAIFGITMYLKYFLQKTLSEKRPLPTTIYPVRLSIDPKKITDINWSLMYSLYSYMVYYSLLHNQLKAQSDNPMANKGFQLFILKMLFSPLVFSFLEYVDKETFIVRVENRLRELYYDSKVFDKLEKTIADQFNYKVIMRPEHVKEAAGKTYDAIIQKWDQIDVTEFVSRLNNWEITRFSAEEFLSYNITQLETVAKIVELEFKKIIKDTEGIPKACLEKFGMTTKKNTSNLERFALESLKSWPTPVTKVIMEIVGKINMSYKDLKGLDIDYNEWPEDLLKSIKLWDPSNDKSMTTNYTYFTKLIQESSLKKDAVIAILNDTEMEVSEAENFVDALELTL